jgi:hypothetical protein
MRLRMVGVGALTAGLLALGGAGAASANVAWCMSDPPVQVVTPGGHALTVNNMVYLSPVDRHLARFITDDATAVPVGPGRTLITVNLYLPAGSHSAFTVASNNRYQVSSSGRGAGGSVITVQLTVPIS